MLLTNYKQTVFYCSITTGDTKIKTVGKSYEEAIARALSIFQSRYNRF